MRPSRALVSWLVAAVTGTALRLYQLPHQVLVDDEWHALHKVLASSPAEILTDFGASDHSIPLTLYDALLERTVGLTELGMRLPSLVAGLAALLAVPALVRGIVGTRTAVVLAWLLAIAPLQIFYSRYARPYEVVFLLSFAAVIAFYDSLCRGSARSVAAYVVCAALAAWFLPVVLPFVAAPLLAGAIVAAGPRRDPSPRRLAACAAVLLGAWLVLLGPPLLAGGGVLAAKAGRGAVEARTIAGATELLLGTASWPLVVALLAAGVAGGVALARRRPGFVAYLGLLCVTQLAALVVLRPHGLRFPIVFARYSIGVAPILLLLIASGLASADRALGRISPLRLPIASAATIALLIALGPLPWIYVWPNDFTNHLSYQADYLPGRYFEEFRPETIPPFYARLAERPPASTTIVEAPWHFFWHDLAYLQRLHRQHVLVGFVDPARETVRDGEVPRARGGVRLRNAVHVGEPEALAARGADLVVFHKRLRDEVDFPFAVAPVDVERWIARYRELLGAPAYEDAWVAVFALGTPDPVAAVDAPQRSGPSPARDP